MNVIDRIFLYLLKRDFFWFWWMLRIGAHLISPFGARKRGTILIYHHVHERLNEYNAESTDRVQFDWHMKLVKRVFHPITIDKVAEVCGTNGCPSRAVVVTFDDGYADNYSEALPILKKYEMPAAIYLAVEALESGYMWNEAVASLIQEMQGPSLDLTGFELGVYPIASFSDREIAIADVIERMKPLKTEIQKDIVKYITDHYGQVKTPPQMLSASQLKNLAEERLITLGCHTLTHPMLSQIGIKEAENDISASKAALEEITSAPVKHFAYPYGKYGEHFHAEHVNLIAKLGFKTAVTTDWGAVSNTSSRYMLTRFTPWDNSPLKFYLRLCSNFNINQS
jgi:peptidoglycan/xylan/chitin deacetylase (PgdA/CDA1 family)